MSRHIQNFKNRWFKVIREYLRIRTLDFKRHSVKITTEYDTDLDWRSQMIIFKSVLSKSHSSKNILGFIQWLEGATSADHDRDDKISDSTNSFSGRNHLSARIWPVRISAKVFLLLSFVHQLDSHFRCSFQWKHT